MRQIASVNNGSWVNHHWTLCLFEKVSFCNLGVRLNPPCTLQSESALQQQSNKKSSVFIETVIFRDIHSGVQKERGNMAHTEIGSHHHEVGLGLLEETEKTETDVLRDDAAFNIGFGMFSTPNLDITSGFSEV